MKGKAYAFHRAFELAQSVRDYAHLIVTDLRIFMRAVTGYNRDTDNSASWHILFIDDCLPDTRLGGGFPRAAKILEAMVNCGWHVTHYPKKSSPTHTAEMQTRFGQNVKFLQGRSTRGLVRALRENMSGYDAIFISRPSAMLTFLRALKRFPSGQLLPFIIYDAEAIFSEREAANRALKGEILSQEERDSNIRNETSLSIIANSITTVKEADASTFRRFSKGSVSVVNYKIDIIPSKARFHVRNDIVIVGSMVGRPDESPNVDSVLWFIDQVSPILRSKHGVMTPLTIIGKTDQQLRERLAGSPVIFAGIVDDLESAYEQARIFVAPTRFSAGIPIKVIEASASGVPCVITPALAHQLEYQDNIHAVVGDDAESFARACANLYNDETLWSNIRDNALIDVNKRFSSQSFDKSVRNVLSEAKSFNSHKLAQIEDPN